MAIGSFDVLLGVTASIAAYKAAEILRGLSKAGQSVQVVMSDTAQRFVGKTTFSGLSGRQVLLDAFSAPSGELHVELAAKASQILVAPATADCLARLAVGRGDDLLGATLLCADCRVVVAPAMHPRMWHHRATQENVKRLVDRGITFVGPVDGPVASGDSGLGRMAEPEQIVAAVLNSGTGSLRGHHVLISAGPTVEDLDPVRFIGNRSTGKMGYALAARALARGARVTLVTGPTHLAEPLGSTVISVRSALEMQSALAQTLKNDLPDSVIMAAAVGDYRAQAASPTKLKRNGELLLELIPNPDIIAGLAAKHFDPRPVFIAFAVETGTDEKIADFAREKLTRKGVDLVVANRADEAFGKDTNRVQLISRDSTVALTTQSKVDVANRILDWLSANRTPSQNGG